MTHFLQSPAWKTFQESLGREVVTDSGKGWSYQAIVETGKGNVRLYCPYGPEATSPEAFKAAIESLQKEGRARRATFLRVEPTTIAPEILKKLGFKRTSYTQLQPAHTQVIDLSLSKEALLAQMSQNSRNITRNYHKKDVTIHHSYNPEDIQILLKLLANVAARNHIRTHSETYFKTQVAALFPTKNAVLYWATFEGSPIAAALVFDSDTTRYYAHAAADDNHRKLAAGTALLGQMILDAKDKGLTFFDLYGIAPTNNPKHPWAGFTKFKQSFGGSPVEFNGAWDLPLKPLPYHAYRLSQSIRRRLR